MLVAGSRPTFTSTLKDPDGVVVDIDGATTKFRYSIAGATVVERDGSIDDGPNGVTSYQFIADELTAGQLRYEWEVTDGAGKIYTQDQPKYRDVRPALT
jgi:hypothetical protein